MRGGLGFGLVELMLVLALASGLSAGLWHLVRPFASQPEPGLSLTPTASATAKLQLLRLQAQQRQLLLAQQGAQP